MTVALLLIDLHLTPARSLKEKRMVLNRLKKQLRAHHNLALAEVDHQDLWQRSGLALVTVSGTRDLATQCLEAACREIEEQLPGEVLSSSVEFLV